MTDNQIREFMIEKTLDELMTLLVLQGTLHERHIVNGNEEMALQCDRTIEFIKTEITNRVCGLA